MNGSKSPPPPSTEAGEVSIAEAHPNTVNGQRNPECEQPKSSGEQQQQQQQQQQQAESTKDAEPSSARVEVKDEAMTDAPANPEPDSGRVASVNEVADEDAESEAETLITSPVKKRESEKQKNNTGAAVKSEPLHQPARMPAPRHRIRGLPVPTDGDDDVDSTASPVPSTETSAAKTTASTTTPTDAASKEEELEDRVNSDVNDNTNNDNNIDRARSEKEDRRIDNDDDDDDDENDDSDRGSGSDSLSSVRSDPPSRASSRSRAASERPEYARHGHGGTQSPNPRKRKHRASSVSLPNKRPSVHAAKPRRLRGLHSEELAAGRSEHSPSPKLRSHRRAVSTQSAFMDGAAEHAHRKRRSATQGPARSDTKTSSKAGWEESDASSETTSHGQPDARRPARGIGRSTSTPGRPPGREHKRHVNKYGFTRLAEACESGDLDLVKEWRDKDPDQLELAEFAGNKPLQIAALNGNVEVVDYLIDQGCQIDCANVDKDTPLIDAAENGHVDVVKSLLNAGVDPLRQNLKGQQALDVVTDDTDDVEDIRAALRKAIDRWNSDGAKQRREEEEEQRHRAGPTKELHFMARTYENLLRLVQINDRTGVREFLDARVPVDNAIITAAAKTGDLYLVNMLLAEMTEKKAFQKPEKPMLGVLGTSHFEMVKSLTELDQFNPLYRNRQGLSWPEIADQRNGPNARLEVDLLRKLYNARNIMKERRSSSPVTKRESGKRRLMQAAGEDDSDDEGAPKRKNGRRLMSRKDMRAASGKAASDSSSDESGSDIVVASEAGDDASMKPPESPPAKRGPGRPRTKSISGPSTETSPGSRRRSSSIRADQALPTVEEKVEEKEIGDRLKEQETQRSIEEAEKLEAERKQHEATEAAAKKALEEEAARQAEEERRADDIRQQEEERRAEEARKAEQERKRIEEEMAEAQRAHRARILASLPGAVAHVLDKQSSFQSDSDQNRLSSYLLQHFTPLQVVRQGHQNADGSFYDGPDAPFWVVNVQAAPLLSQVEAGKSIETMVRSDVPGYENSIADVLGLKEVQTGERTRVASMLANVLDDFPLHPTDIDQEGLSLLSFEKELRRASDRSSSVANIKERLSSGHAILRYMDLDMVVKELHHVLRGAQIDVRFDYFQSDTTRLHADKEDTGFVECLGAAMDKRPRPRTYVDGSMLMPYAPTSALGSTRVTVVHSK